MRIGSLQKTSFIDYPGCLSALIFTQGCNFRCPFCHNPELVLPGQFTAPLAEEEILSFLETRQGKLDGVVITGGEPTLHADLPDFIARIKDLGFAVKLDTNGTCPDMIASLLDKDLVDYLAMDIKAPLEHYSLLTGVSVDTDAIRRSIALILEDRVPAEFRTTVMRPLLSPEDILAIGPLIEGARLYILQNFVPSKHVIPDLDVQPYDEEELRRLAGQLGRHVRLCQVR